MPHRSRPRVARPYAHREPYADHFARLASAEDAATALRRLIPYLDAALDGAARLALWQALWRCMQRLQPVDAERATTCLDGRHAAALRPLNRDWADPVLIEHLCGHGDFAQGVALTVALLAHHGLDPWAAPEQHRPSLLLHAARATLADVQAGLDGATRDRLQQALESAAGLEPALLPQAQALLFELALASGDEDAATATLARLLHRGDAEALRHECVRAWLDGSTVAGGDTAIAPPFLLADAAQARWLQPARWGSAAALQTLHQALSRSAPRRRVRALADALAALGELAAAAALPAPPAPEDFDALARLDKAYAGIEGGEDITSVLLHAPSRETFSPAVQGMLWRASARWHAAGGDTESELLALSRARLHGADDALRARLAALLPAGTPMPDADGRREEPGWRALLATGSAAQQRLAALQLATLHTEGQLEPHAPHRRQQADLARPHWLRLRTEPRYAALAQEALDSQAQTLAQPALRQGHGESYLWFERPGARGVLIVFSCMLTHHRFTAVAGLLEGLKDRHLMFVGCPEQNWYSDASFERVQALLREQVASRFTAEDVSCWYGSMGGHAALKFGLSFGWRAMVFNPQTDLDLWAAFSPRERNTLWNAERHTSLQHWPLPAWENMPFYYACGASTADREALSAIIDTLRRCGRLNAVIEKYDDPQHAALMRRIVDGPVPAALARIDLRLRELAAQARPEGDGLSEAEALDFWQQLEAARATKVEIQVRDGRLWCRASLSCGTR